MSESTQGPDAPSAEIDAPCVCSPFIRVPWCHAEHDIEGCGAEHPTNTSVIPCMIVARPHTEHWSWSGCAGSHVTWMTRVIPPGVDL